ncbi:hypothetical protein IFM89_035285 [Coptis chinensis]|uniref:Uncharacterized protein n=1 Tax=Coptis chinensis TaxID=261450 RepID=A0A835GZH3_9MAGN|nr:hypothetical protein IFM89_035285 [Coptis chinensis]
MEQWDLRNQNMGKVPHVLVVPLPAQGHVMPLMSFAQRLVDHGVKVTFVNAEFIHKKLVSSLINHKEEKEDRRIHLVPITGESNINDDRTDEQIFYEFISENTQIHLEKLINTINESGNEKIDCVVADPYLGWTLEFTEKLGIKRAAFWNISLSALAFTLLVPKLLEEGVIDDKGYPMKEENIRLPPSMPAMSSVDFYWGFSDDIKLREILSKFLDKANKGAKAANWIVCNSWCELEPASNDFIPNILTIGPLLASEQLGHPTGQLLPEDSTCLTWLDQQPAQSVIYLAFGSTTIFNKSQFNELVHGLELVNRPFLWVVRSDFTDELSSLYTDSFKVRLAHYGKIVDWAPQQKVLAHPSIACFVTHCGWSSVVEGVGLRLDKDENGVVTGTEINKKVQELLGNEGIRSRANKLKDVAKRTVSEGGSSSEHFKDFINWIKG